MSESSFTLTALKEMPLIDQLQWGRLNAELDLDELIEFCNEYFSDLRQTWFESKPDPFQLEEENLRSLAHRFAGTAGTIGFKKIRHVFLCIEYAPDLKQAAEQFVDPVKSVYQETEAWVRDLKTNK